MVDGRTDEGVCPYCVALSLIKGTPLSKQRGRPLIQQGRFFVSKKASLDNEETPPLSDGEASQ